MIDRSGGVGSVCNNESVTCGVKVNVPAKVGVPKISPVEESRIKPSGSVPVKLHVSVPVPPLAAKLRL